MELIEIAYKKPPKAEIALYTIHNSDYIELNGGGYSRQKYIKGRPVQFHPTTQWPTIGAWSVIWNGMTHFSHMDKSLQLKQGDQLTLSVTVEGL